MAAFPISNNQRKWLDQACHSGANPQLDARVMAGWQRYHAMADDSRMKSAFITTLRKTLKRIGIQFKLRNTLTRWGII